VKTRADSEGLELEQVEKPRAGTGYWIRNEHELLLVGRRGRIPAPAPGTQIGSVIMAPVGRHSAKPGIVAQTIERHFPTTPKIELFARGKQPGWDVWGPEAED
jgi:N6-adenosine-specific RNA methylase IME4